MFIETFTIVLYGLAVTFALLLSLFAFSSALRAWKAAEDTIEYTPGSVFAIEEELCDVESGHAFFRVLDNAGTDGATVADLMVATCRTRQWVLIKLLHAHSLGLVVPVRMGYWSLRDPQPKAIASPVSETWGEWSPTE